VFAGIIVIIAVALLTYQSLMWLKRRFFKWEAQA
jgi:ABC-type nitrate/sulfonate/bicarbonate transport system permease component